MDKSKFEKFKAFWNDEISKIEGEVLDARGVRLIYLSFHVGELKLITSMPTSEYTFDMQLEIELLESKLTRALESARTRYISQNPSLWVKISEIILGIIMRVPKSTGT